MRFLEREIAQSDNIVVLVFPCLMMMSQNLECRLPPTYTKRITPNRSHDSQDTISKKIKLYHSARIFSSA